MSTIQTVPIIFKGVVSAESAQGEVVTVQVTNSDGTLGPSTTGQTVDDGLNTPNSITYTTAPANVNVGSGATQPSAIASIDADNADGAAKSAPLKFDALRPRTVTLNIA